MVLVLLRLLPRVFSDVSGQQPLHTLPHRRLVVPGDPRVDSVDGTESGEDGDDGVQDDLDGLLHGSLLW